MMPVMTKEWSRPYGKHAQFRYYSDRLLAKTKGKEQARATLTEASSSLAREPGSAIGEPEKGTSVHAISN
jgi:hypothetical protein